MWSVTVGMVGPQGVSDGHQEEKGVVTQSSVVVVVVVVVWEFLGGSSPPPGLAPHQSRDGEARTVGAISPSLGMRVPEGFVVFFPQLLHGWGTSI